MIDKNKFKSLKQEKQKNSPDYFSFSSFEVFQSKMLSKLDLKKVENSFKELNNLGNSIKNIARNSEYLDLILNEYEENEAKALIQLDNEKKQKEKFKLNQQNQIKKEKSEVFYFNENSLSYNHKQQESNSKFIFQGFLL